MKSTGSFLSTAAAGSAVGFEQHTLEAVAEPNVLFALVMADKGRALFAC
jgi:hypothetical protein